MMQKKANQLRSQTLKFDDKEESHNRRVSIQAIDFDWIFTDNNAENFILLLAKHAESKLLIQKSIKTFIDLIW